STRLTSFGGAITPSYYGCPSRESVGGLQNLPKDSQEIASKKRPDGIVRISSGRQRFRNRGKARGVFRANGRGRDAVKVRSEAYVPRGDQVHYVIDVPLDVVDGRAGASVQKRRTELDVHDPACLRQRPDLCIGQVARVIAHRARVGVRGDDGRLADVQHVPEARVRQVGDVHHHT